MELGEGPAWWQPQASTGHLSSQCLVKTEWQAGERRTWKDEGSRPGPVATSQGMHRLPVSFVAQFSPLSSEDK